MREDVQGACEVLGLDPLYLANEGRMVAFVAAGDADRAVEIMRSHAAGAGATVAGRVIDDGRAVVSLRSRIGVTRIVDMFSGEQLPRIC